MTTETKARRIARPPQPGSSKQRDENYELQPLPDQELVQIWQQLPESRRLPFILALDEPICNRLLVLTMPAWPRKS